MSDHKIKYLIDLNVREYDDQRNRIKEYSVREVKVIKETVNFVTVEYRGEKYRYDKRIGKFTTKNLLGVMNCLFDSKEEALKKQQY